MKRRLFSVFFYKNIFHVKMFKNFTNLGDKMKINKEKAFVFKLTEVLQLSLVQTFTKTFSLYCPFLKAEKTMLALLGKHPKVTKRLLHEM